MKNLVLLLMLLVSIPYSYATDFIVSPYVLKQTDDHNILKFRLNKEKELDFMHFKGKGHILLADALYNKIK